MLPQVYAWGFLFAYKQDSIKEGLAFTCLTALHRWFGVQFCLSKATP